MQYYLNPNITVNGHPISQFKFPGGEIQISIENCIKNLEYSFYSRKQNVFTIDARLLDSDDIMTLLLTTNALKNMNNKIQTKSKYNIANMIIDLNLLYIPYARQDRICNEYEAFSLEVFANLINSQEYNKVRLLDPHSNISNVLINNSVSRTKFIDNNITSIIKQIYKNTNDNTINIVIPDLGATKRVMNILRNILNTTNKENNINFNIIQCNKQRDLKTGEIKSLQIYDIDSIKTTLHNDGNDIFLIIDDICDGGRTFVEISKALTSAFNINPELQLYLYVTHGIFSGGHNNVNNIMKNFKTIYTTDSILHRTLELQFKYPDKFSIFKL